MSFLIFLRHFDELFREDIILLNLVLFYLSSFVLCLAVISPFLYPQVPTRTAWDAEPPYLPFHTAHLVLGQLYICIDQSTDI